MMTSIYPTQGDGLATRYGKAPRTPESLSDDTYDAHSVTADALRTPLTSIRSFSEILLDNPDLAPEDRAAFLEIMVAESERLERAINLVLNEANEGDMAA